MNKDVKGFAIAILHGDTLHREWLLKAADDYINGRHISLPSSECAVCRTEPYAIGPGCSCNHAPCIHDHNAKVLELSGEPDNS